jgi:hypothetical protein
MKTKLTLSVDKNLVHIARDQAQAEGTSVSAMFSKFIASQKLSSERKANPSVKSMVGTLKAYKIDDSKSSIRSTYADKHFH